MKIIQKQQLSIVSNWLLLRCSQGWNSKFDTLAVVELNLPIFIAPIVTFFMGLDTEYFENSLFTTINDHSLATKFYIFF